MDRRDGSGLALTLEAFPLVHGELGGGFLDGVALDPDLGGAEAAFEGVHFGGGGAGLSFGAGGAPGVAALAASFRVETVFFIRGANVRWEGAERILLRRNFGKRKAESGKAETLNTETIGATAGFLEYSGQGLTTFERAMDRDERLMGALGARLLETQKRVGETAEAIELRQSGENSILGGLAMSLGMSMTLGMRWAYWWNSTEAWPDDVTKEQVSIELNTDFSTKGLRAQEITAVVQA
jgi:hypothetical protein